MSEPPESSRTDLSASFTGEDGGIPSHQGAFDGQPRNSEFGCELTLITRRAGGSSGAWTITGAIVKNGDEPSAWMPGHVDPRANTDDTDGLLEYFAEKQGGNGYNLEALSYWIESPADAIKIIHHYAGQLEAASPTEAPDVASVTAGGQPNQASAAPPPPTTSGDPTPANSDRTVSRRPGVRLTRVGRPDWVGVGTGDIDQNDLGGQAEWHFATPWIFQALASPTTFRPFLAAPGKTDQHGRLHAYWTSLLYLLLYRLGWADPLAGMSWWRDAGFPTDDQTLRLVDAIWRRDGHLPGFEVWLQRQPRPFLNLFEERCRYRPPVRSDGRWDTPDPSTFDRLGPAGLHLEQGSRNHLTRAFEGDAGTGHLLRGHQGDRLATFVTDSMIGWYGALVEHGKALPDIGNRSWHVEVYAKPVGFLGTYRRSRETGIWFTGRHSTHRAGT